MLSEEINILSIEKDIFSEFQSNFYHFLKSLENNDINPDISNHILLLNKKINDLNSMLIDLKYTISDKNKINNKKKNKKIRKELKEYRENEKIISKVLPYMIYLKLNQK